ncbi:hypothetical protein JZ751_025208, partial [Albula glossodonta]
MLFRPPLWTLTSPCPGPGGGSCESPDESRVKGIGVLKGQPGLSCQVPTCMPAPRQQRRYRAAAEALWDGCG